MKKFIVRIPIQSFSDVVTNSSSELFAVIKDSDRLDDIYHVLFRIFGWNQESEETMCINQYIRPTQEQLNNWEWSCWIKDSKNPEDYPEEWIEIEIPYRLNDYRTFFKIGIESILKERFGDNFTIEYYEE